VMMLVSLLTGALAASFAARHAPAHAQPRAAVSRLLMVSKVATEQDYHAILESGRVCVIEFTAEHCRACHAMSPKLKRLARDYRAEVDFFNVDFDENKPLVKALGIRALPYFEIISSGVKLESFACPPSKISRVQQRLEAHGIHPAWHRRPDRWLLRRQQQFVCRLRSKRLPPRLAAWLEGRRIKGGETAEAAPEI